MTTKIIKVFVAFAFVPLGAIAQTNFTIIESFPGAPGPSIPFCTLVADTSGVFYGTTVAGGTSTNGTVFVLNSNGSGKNTLHSFMSASNGAFGGGGPYAGLVLGSDSNLYGTTYAGGTSNFGTVFKISKDGSGFTVLHSFTGGTDSENPEGGLVEGTDGALYGTTYFGNSSARGTIFKINKDGNGYSVLHTFTGKPDGQQPECRLLQGSDGALYGTTSFGGSNNVGSIFALNEDGNGYHILYSFATSITGDGNEPVAGLIEGSDHVLYGTAYLGGGSGYNGTVFKINKGGGGYQILRRFSTTGNDGQMPNGELMEGADGALYGGTGKGGVSTYGTIYKLNKDGSGYSILRTFSGSDGQTPKCALIQLSNGVFYGTTELGAVGGAGCVFALSTSPLPPRIVSLSTSSKSNFLQFAATSTIQYDIQRSTNLDSWSLLTTLTSQTNGQFNCFFTDHSG